ncbi:MAG: site-specific integrase [Alphaproteobacteria bacterium]
MRLALKRMVRGRGARQKQAAPVTFEIASKLLGAVGAGLHGARDRALLCVAYDTLCRRSELVALSVADVQDDEDGSGSILVRRSKGDQEGHGSVRYLAPQTVQAVRDWLHAAHITEGALFRSLGRAGAVGDPLTPQEVARILRRLCLRAGIDPAGIGGHSTRVGAAQDMVAAGLEVGEIMQAGGWKTPVMVARYAERLSVRRGAAAKLARAQGRTNPPAGS